MPNFEGLDDREQRNAHLLLPPPPNEKIGNKSPIIAELQTNFHVSCFLFALVISKGVEKRASL